MKGRHIIHLTEFDGDRMKIILTSDCLRVSFGIANQIFDYELEEGDNRDTFSYNNGGLWLIGFGVTNSETRIIKWR